MKQTCVLHALWAGKFEHGTSLSDGEWLVLNVDHDFDTLCGISSCCLNLGLLRLEVTDLSWLIKSFNLDSIGGGLLEEVSELEGLHDVCTKGAPEW